jgi:hypothetical protein
MATKAWVGGATAVAQIETFTLNDDWDDSETALTMTMTAEDGSTQTESVTPSGVDESADLPRPKALPRVVSMRV